MAPGSDQPLGGSLDALHSTESEAELIGSAMYMPDVCEAAGLFDKVTRAHIFDLGHEAIWGAIIDLWKAGIAPKPALVRDRIGANEHFDALGGLLYLNNLLADSSPSTASFHADAIVDRHARRQLFAAASDAAARCIDLASGPATSLLDELEKQTSAIAAGATRGTAWINAGDMIADAVEKARQRKGGIEFPTGLTLLDETMGGLHRGDLSLLGARPGMAKTVSAQAIAKNISAAGRGVAFFSLEMGGEPMALRLAVDLTFDRDAPIYNNQDAHNITLDRINKQDLQPHEWDRLTQAGQIVKSWPLAYDVRPSLTMADIRAALRIQFR
ncbi:MAG: hypothetical protein EBS42_15555, partial [Caulobacteraceae bacterium]|nr:hypothetical protein [Caulobacteraceae bacterium]